MKVTIVARKNLNTIIEEINLNQPNPTLDDLKKEFFKSSKVDVNRQYFNIVGLYSWDNIMISMERNDTIDYIYIEESF